MAQSTKFFNAPALLATLNIDINASTENTDVHTKYSILAELNKAGGYFSSVVLPTLLPDK
ncbi:hypothetical protein [Colwellia sp. C1TZA3]|uniref:hypothetical protein n=1 Tax=Colwellia sp. C1TZA3 TaxID=2508879 RepID=UPI0011B9562B|nr:hypothetical protein [Colwellia sp. C1TZA3]TWX71145.1 hypothetical protein ESZ39_09785 [Colwellia sp. C1TZA3]